MISRDLLESRKSAGNFDIGEWQIDRTHDILLPRAPDKSFAPNTGQTHSPWPLWGLWYETGGEEGEKPIPEVKKLLEYYEKMVSHPDKEMRYEAGKNMVRAQAENLWSIGTVGMRPTPIIISNKLKNVPKYGYFQPGLGNLHLYHPAQFYLEQ